MVNRMCAGHTCVMARASVQAELYCALRGDYRGNCMVMNFNLPVTREAIMRDRALWRASGPAAPERRVARGSASQPTGFPL